MKVYLALMSLFVCGTIFGAETTVDSGAVKTVYPSAPVTQAGEPARKPYVVKAGDTAESILRSAKINSSYVDVLLKINQMRDTSEITAGKSILVPVNPFSDKSKWSLDMLVKAGPKVWDHKFTDTDFDKLICYLEEKYHPAYEVGEIKYVNNHGPYHPRYVILCYKPEISADSVYSFPETRYYYNPSRDTSQPPEWGGFWRSEPEIDIRQCRRYSAQGKEIFHPVEKDLRFTKKTHGDYQGDIVLSAEENRKHMEPQEPEIVQEMFDVLAENKIDINPAASYGYLLDSNRTIIKIYVETVYRAGSSGSTSYSVKDRVTTSSGGWLTTGGAF